MGTHLGGTSVEDSEKAGWKADSVQSVVNRQSYKTEEKKRKFIWESFQLDKEQNIKCRCKIKRSSV